MGERKVLNSSDIPMRRQTKNRQMKIRVMLPMTIRCATCANYLYKGTKFKSLMENIIGETYLGIKIFRFYLNCTNCSNQITYKTNPKNSDYIVESGAIWEKRDSEETMGVDPVKSLAKRTLESKSVMDIVAALHELKHLKSRQANLNA